MTRGTDMPLPKMYGELDHSSLWPSLQVEYTFTAAPTKSEQSYYNLIIINHIITVSDKMHIICQNWSSTSNFLTFTEQFEDLRPHDDDKHKWKLEVIFWFNFIWIILPSGLRWSRMIRTTNRLWLGIIIIQGIRITWVV